MVTPKTAAPQTTASPQTIVFLHAHPDDEAIFTAGTMAMLAAKGHRVILIVATSGELGVYSGRPIDLGPTRQQESIECCAALGVDEVVFLGYQDSGLHGENFAGFAHVALQAVTDRLCAELEAIGPVDAIVSYDDHGIYGHPDHVHVHKAAQAAAAQSNIATIYEATVDREYLHFVETHVVVEAGLGERPKGRGLAASALGMPSVMIDTTVDARAVLTAKRAAMEAHASQLPADAPAFALGQQNYSAVYGYEWYRRLGPPAAIEQLPLA